MSSGSEEHQTPALDRSVRAGKGHARIAGGAGAVELAPDYTVKVDYGSNPNAINSDNSLTDSDGDYYYDKFPYVRIYNQKIIDYLTIDDKRVCYTTGCIVKLGSLLICWYK